MYLNAMPIDQILCSNDASPIKNRFILQCSLSSDIVLDIIGFLFGFIKIRVKQCGQEHENVWTNNKASVDTNIAI